MSRRGSKRASKKFATNPSVSEAFDEMIVVDNLPMDIPICSRELEVIETHFNALLAEILEA